MPTCFAAHRIIVLLTVQSGVQNRRLIAMQSIVHAILTA